MEKYIGSCICKCVGVSEKIYTHRLYYLPARTEIVAGRKGAGAFCFCLFLISSMGITYSKFYYKHCPPNKKFLYQL